MVISFENHSFTTDGCGQSIDLTDDVLEFVDRSQVQAVGSSARRAQCRESLGLPVEGRAALVNAGTGVPARWWGPCGSSPAWRA